MRHAGAIRWNHYHRLKIPAITIMILASCKADDPTFEPQVRLPIARAVIGDAAGQIDAEGRFKLRGPLALPYGQISADRAVALTDAFKNGQMRGFMPTLERDRGEGITVSSLRTCGRIYYAEPALEPLPSDVAPAIRRAHGPHWIINYCSPTGRPTISVALSAYATDLQLRDGQVIFPVFDGGEYFHPIGVPKDRDQGLPGSPEDAVSEIAASAGVRVSSVPHLVTLPRMLPTLSFWQVDLERPVTVHGRESRNDFTTSTVYFTDDPRWGHRGRWVQERNAATDFEYSWPQSRSRDGSHVTFRTARARIRPGFAAKIEPVEEPSR